MNIHIHNPEVNVQESERRICRTWVFCHWLNNNLSAKCYSGYIPAYIQGQEKLLKGGPRSKVGTQKN